MTCPICAQSGQDPAHIEQEHERLFHQLILDWQASWAGDRGWARKKALADAKRLGRATVGRKR